jgi:hypothetical protein
MMHLRYDMMTASMYCDENRHPELVMWELGIKYQHATPQSMGDQWWFWNCTGVPVEFPRYLTPLGMNPQKCVGWGLNQKDADKIARAGSE